MGTKGQKATISRDYFSAFSDQNQSTEHPKDYNMWANRGHPCFYKNHMALLVTFCIQIPSSRVQSPSFGGSARVRLGIKEEGSFSASSDQDHSTQHQL